MASPYPELRQITVTEISTFRDPPSLQIRTDEDVNHWKQTQGYQDYGLFLRRLSESVVGKMLPWHNPTPSKAITAIVDTLNTLDSWIDQIPPQESPQRFGNLAFRTWGKRLEDEADKLLEDMLRPELYSSIPYLRPYFVTSFGSFSRMDYGTGHETSFALFLLCLSLVRFLDPNVDQERDIVLIVFLRYLCLCWRLQDVYRLEPAGSHGVWGLDDYSFLGYIFGSAQLRDSDVPVASALQTPLPPTNLYYMSINRIREVKTGPFHEHSSQLHSIAVGVPKWAKVNSGLFKMYEAEVLGKRVVVQHIPLGGLLAWKDHTPSGSVSTSGFSATIPAHAPWTTPSTHSNSPEMPISHDSAGFTTPLPRHDSVHNLGATVPSQRFGPQRVNHGPLVPAQLPLGPMANTTLRPSVPHDEFSRRRSRSSSNRMDPPIGPSPSR